MAIPTPVQSLRTVYLKGTRLFCTTCFEHLTTLAVTLCQGDLITPEIFEPGMGQGPWKSLEPMLCRKCRSSWGLHYGKFLALDAPGV